ncbi:MAG: PA14 domain-containing protein [Ginsengibacter sp.]
MPTKGFTAGHPVIFGAYGNGANPVITGFSTVSSWNNIGSNLWESTSAVSKLNDLNLVVIDGVNTPMGRYPNSGYFTYQSHSSNVAITSSSLNAGQTNWTGADVVMKTFNFTITRNPIISASGNTINYASTARDNNLGNNGFGFFIENDARTLDVQNEWYFNPSTKKLRIYSKDEPGKVQVSTLDTLVYMIKKANLTFDGIDFTGSNRRAFFLGSNANITIQNCNFNYHGLYAIWGGNNYGTKSTNFNFNHNTVNHVNSQGLILQSEFNKAYIGHNSFKNCGVFAGMFKVASMSDIWNQAYGSIRTENTNGLVVEYNSVDSTGYTGIHFGGNNTSIHHNEVSHHCMVLMDGGGIYTWTGPHAQFKASKIYNNIVHDGIGDNQGSTNGTRPTLVQGIYCDENTGNTEVYNNVCFNNPSFGIFSNSNSHMNFHDNTCYNNGVAQVLWSSQFRATHSELGAYITEYAHDDTARHNIFFAKGPTQLTAEVSTKLDDVNVFFNVLDSNFYARPIDDNVTFFIQLNSFTSFLHYNMDQWKSYVSVKDHHSKKSPKSVTKLEDMRLEYNATTESKTISLDGTYMDVRNVLHKGTITLAPYTSIILIRHESGDNQSPIAKAGGNKTITLPINTVNLTGSGTDGDGTIVSYAWTKIAGPSAGTIADENSASTSITGLLKGIYQYKLKVTDNNGAAGLDTITITVNAAANVPPKAKAGDRQTITLPTNSVHLNGGGTDEDGTIEGYEWRKISGPSAANITSANSASPSITDLGKGSYMYELKVTDNDEATGFDTVTIVVNAAVIVAANIPPTADAGDNQSVTLPKNAVSIKGSGSDKDGSISSYTWTKISGPSLGKITDAGSASTTVTELGKGVYKFQLDVTDNEGATTSDTVRITVIGEEIITSEPDPANLLPAVNPHNTVNGLDYKYYESRNGWTSLPDFSNSNPLKTGQSDGFDISHAKRSVAFAFSFTGFIEVPADGEYTFYTTSDDGSNLSIDNVPVVNNDGLHSARERSGIIGLEAGKHAISVSYFQQGGGHILGVSYSGPGVNKQAIPDAALYRISVESNRSALAVNKEGIDKTIPAVTQVSAKTYPNPFVDYIELKITGGVAGSYQLMLVDISGRVIWTKIGMKSAGNFEQSINTSALMAGSYFLKVIQNKTSSVIKLVK